VEPARRKLLLGCRQEGERDENISTVNADYISF
jgi:hypothetical protein